MQKHNVHVPVLTAEDETSIKAEIKYCQKTDELIGFCGKKGKEEDGQKCSMPNTRIIIGDDESSYSKLTEAFRDRTIASYARVILLNPLSTLLPRAVVLLLPTCNRFTANDVKDQWESIHRYYVEKLESVIGPLIGHASDGDSRRRSLMLIKP